MNNQEQPTLSIPPDSIYQGAGVAAITPEETQALLAPVPEEEIELRPDGHIYWPAARFRRRLAEVLGAGASVILPVQSWVDGGHFYTRAVLLVRGCFVAEAIGEASYDPRAEEGDDRARSYATAAEAAHSSALTRLCKGLGMGSEVWVKSYADKWRQTYARAVWCTNVGKGKLQGTKRKLWRLKTAPPLEYPWKEGEVAQDGDRSSSPAPAPTSSPYGDIVDTGRGRRTTRQAPPDTSDVPPPEDPPADRRRPSDQTAEAAVAPAIARITAKQVAEFEHVTKAAGWGAKEVDVLLERFGITFEKMIPAADFADVMDLVRSPRQLQEIRDQLAAIAS